MINKTQDTIALLGKILPDGTGRDAVHVAVAPVIAAHHLRPGDRISWINKEEGTVGRSVGNGMGIVDPFIRVVVAPGNRFFAWLYPGSVTSLRHAWSHPAFEEEETRVADSPKAKESREWLSNFAAGIDINLDTLLDTAAEAAAAGKDMWFGEETGHGSIPDEFWTHFEIVTGDQVPEPKRAKRYGCSC